MSDNETHWFLCNIQTRFESGALDANSARKLCADIPLKETSDWRVWQDGWSEWKSLVDVSDLYAFVQRPPATPPPIPIVPPPIPPRPPAIVAKVPVVVPKPALPVVVEALPVAENERRKSRRYDIRLRVIIRNEQLTFRTFSINISLGGICLEDEVPAHLFDQKCQIFIAGPDHKENLRFNLAITSRNDLHYFSFENLEEASGKKLASWLDRYGDKQKSA